MMLRINVFVCCFRFLRLWIWAMAYRPERGWGMSHKSAGAEPAVVANELGALAAPRRQARKQHADGRALTELLFILIYVSLCYAVFKVFRIPVNQWSLAPAALGGIIGTVLLLFPFTATLSVSE